MISAGTVGFIIFSIIKIVGNSLLLMILFRNSSKLKALQAGFTKTLLGAVAGIFTLSLLGMLTDHTNTYAFYSIVIILRTLEWAFVLHRFYLEEFALRKFKTVAITTAGSSLLDIFAVAGLVSKTGLVC